MIKSILKSVEALKKLEEKSGQVFDIDTIECALTPGERNKKRKQFVASKLAFRPRSEQIKRESLEIMSTTTNPKTFWGRYNDVLRFTEMDWSGGVPSGKLEQAAHERTSMFQKTLEPLVIDFIDRCIAAGKGDLLHQSMKEHKDLLSKDVLSYYEWKREQI